MAQEGTSGAGVGQRCPELLPVNALMRCWSDRSQHTIFSACSP